MPELPEVESLRRILARTVVGRRIVSASITEPRLRRRVSSRLSQALTDLEIRALRRRAKYLILELSRGRALLVHLGMSGSLTCRAADFASDLLDPRHDHAVIRLDDGHALVYNDPRRFGLLKLVDAKSLDSLDELRTLGPEPMGDGFSADYLAGKARGRKAAVKNFLMDQRIVAGIGNIYAAEILFRAAVRPKRSAGRVSRSEFGRIVSATRQVLREAIDSRGTTFRSYLDSRGEPGAFSRQLRVYGREGEPCYTCSTPIRSITLGQRASFYCPKCQR